MINRLEDSSWNISLGKISVLYKKIEEEEYKNESVDGHYG